MALTNDEKAILDSYLVNRPHEGMTAHEGYHLLKERYGLTTGSIRTYLKKIGNVKLKTNGKPYKRKGGHVYLPKYLVTQRQAAIESRWLTEVSKER